MKYIGRLLAFLFGALILTQAVGAQSVGTCDRSLGEAYLDVNNVRARIPSTGQLFYRGEPHMYRIPRFGDSNAIFAGSLWIGGIVNGEIRAAATEYGPGDFWAGPIDEQGNRPDDCLQYDRVYKLSVADIRHYEESGIAVDDLRDWPTGLGAPTEDATSATIDLLGQPLSTRKNRVIDLDAGERPALRGHQDIWWIMNDQGNMHRAPPGEPLGIEVHGTAFAFQTSIDAVNDATLYHYRLINRNDLPIENTYVGMYLDIDLGGGGDDYVGSDSVRGIGFVYNADNEDEGSEGYGTPPPALGIMFLEGPFAPADLQDNNSDGRIDEPGERHATTTFGTYWDGGALNESPGSASHFYTYLQGKWKDGTPFTVGGIGYRTSNFPTHFMYSGDPVTANFWSEMNTDGLGTMRPPFDRRMFISSGPFSLAPGEETDFTFAIVWALGADHLDSVTEMKKAADVVRASYESGFSHLPPGAPPQETVELISPAFGVSQQPTDPKLIWNSMDDAEAYEIKIELVSVSRLLTSITPSIRVDSLVANELYAWKVRGINVHGAGPWSKESYFRTGSVSFAAENLVFSAFLVTANAAGPLEPPDMAAFAFSSSGFPEVPCVPGSTELCDRPTRGFQQSTSNAVWGIHAGGAGRDWGTISQSSSFLARVTRNGANMSQILNYSFEMRFTDRGGKAIRLWEDGAIIDVPFELWNIGKGTPDDPSDDYRMIPIVCEEGCGAGRIQGVFDISGDHPVSGAANDPFTDWVSWYNPENTSPGDSGYESYFVGTSNLGDEVFAGLVLVLWNGGSEPPYAADLPESGTVFRIVGSEDIAPLLAAPRNQFDLQGDAVTFFWSGYLADRFRLQISLNPDFTFGIESDSVFSGHTVALTQSGRYYWHVQSSTGAWSDTWAFDLEFLAVASESHTGDVLPNEFRLYENYPNPFNSSTNITFDVPRMVDVRIAVYDILGREINVLLEQQLAPGRHNTMWNGRNRVGASVGSGVYFYRLETNDAAISKRMVLLK